MHEVKLKRPEAAPFARGDRARGRQIDIRIDVLSPAVARRPAEARHAHRRGGKARVRLRLQAHDEPLSRGARRRGRGRGHGRPRASRMREGVGGVDAPARGQRARGVRGPARPFAARAAGEVPPHEPRGRRCRASIPAAMAEASEARRRLVYEELLLLELMLMRQARERERGREPVRHVVDGPRTAALARALPFELTDEQKRAKDDILSALAAPRAANHLLLGDVGTGKTAVAAFAPAAAADTGTQALSWPPPRCSPASTGRASGRCSPRRACAGACSPAPRPMPRGETSSRASRRGRSTCSSARMRFWRTTSRRAASASS